MCGLYVLHLNIAVIIFPTYPNSVNWLYLSMVPSLFVCAHMGRLAARVSISTVTNGKVSIGVGLNVQSLMTGNITTREVSTIVFYDTSVPWFEVANVERVECVSNENSGYIYRYI